MQCIVVKSDEFENSSPLYIFPLNPDYVAARSLWSLRSNQCLHNKSGSHGVPNANLLVNFGKVLCLSANELQENSNASSSEDCIPQIYY